MAGYSGCQEHSTPTVSDAFVGAGPGALSTCLTVGQRGVSGETDSSFVCNTLTIGCQVAFISGRIQAGKPGFNNFNQGAQIKWP